MNRKLHFWYSRHLAGHINRRYHDCAPNMALIDGKRVHYNIANKTDQHGTDWVDTVYLGSGRWTPLLAEDMAVLEAKEEHTE